MRLEQQKTNLQIKSTSKAVKFVLKVREQKYLYLMSVPFVIWLIVFRYVPIWGWVMAFKKYKPGIPFADQQWLGLSMFSEMFGDPQFYLAMRNTLVMSILGLIAGFAIPIIFALMLNEIRSVMFKRTIQTISYLPHFVSWVIAASIISKMLSIDGGAINELLLSLHIIKEPFSFLAEGKYFWAIVTISDIWKETGWNTIIYLAAMAGVDASLYEAASADGAGRFRRMWHITLPGIRSTIIILLVLGIGNLISIGFEKQMLLQNPLVTDYSTVLDLYILRYGIGLNRYSFGTAVGIFKSVISVILLLLANKAAKKIGEGSVI